MANISAKNRELIHKLRAEHAHMLTPKYEVSQSNAMLAKIA